MKDEPKETVDGIRCLKCKDEIYSAYTHDFKYCKCGACFIDGGREYTRIGGYPKDYEKIQIEPPKEK